MTKTFMTATGANRQLQIERSDDAVMIRQYDPEFTTQKAKTFFLNPSDAPALALAVLEAAYGPDHPVPHKIREAWTSLYVHIAEEETRAKEQADLEAEALELRNAFSLAIGGASIDSFEGHSVNKPGWIDAARRAREMRNEKKVNTND